MNELPTPVDQGHAPPLKPSLFQLLNPPSAKTSRARLFQTASFPTFASMKGPLRLHLALVLAGAALIGAGCQKESQTQTTIPATWRNPDFSGAPFGKFFVLGVAKSDENRRLYEDHMVRALQEQGASAQASSVLFPQSEKLDRAEVLLAVEQAQFDAVVIARLRSVHEKEQYVPAQPLTSSDLYMSGYDEAYAVNSAPAHYAKTTTYRVETTIYSARDEMLVWVLVSDTVNPESVEDIIQSLSATIARQMKAGGLIR